MRTFQTIENVSLPHHSFTLTLSHSHHYPPCRIQDSGIGVLISALSHSHSLRLLDISYCFITGKLSSSLLTRLVQSRDRGSGLELLLCEGNIFSATEKKNILSIAVRQNVGMLFSGRLKICFPIRPMPSGVQR